MHFCIYFFFAYKKYHIFKKKNKKIYANFAYIFFDNEKNICYHIFFKKKYMTKKIYEKKIYAEIAYIFFKNLQIYAGKKVDHPACKSFDVKFFVR